MNAARRPFLSLLLCFSLAVNLLVPLASATGLFVEICSGHRTILIPASGALEPEVCEICLACCTPCITPASGCVPVSLASFTIALPDPRQRASRSVQVPSQMARAPPFLSV